MTKELQFTKIGGVTNGIELSCKDGDLSTSNWETYRVRITEEQGSDEVYHPYITYIVDCQVINAGVKSGQSPCENNNVICIHSLGAIRHMLDSRGKKITMFYNIVTAVKILETFYPLLSPTLVKVKSVVGSKDLWGVVQNKNNLDIVGDTTKNATLEQRTEWFRGTVEESEGID